MFALSPLRAQDALSDVFRESISHVAAVAGWSDLRDDRQVVREIRVYQGFGIGIPNWFARVWQDEGGQSHVHLGHFWTPLTSGLPRDGRDYEREFRTHMDTAFACTQFRRSADMHVCTPRRRLGRNEVARLSTALWALELDSLRKPINEPLGLDGWTVVVEYRSASGYRSASAWGPGTESPDAGVRLIAQIAALVSEAAERVRGRAVRR